MVSSTSSALNEETGRIFMDEPLSVSYGSDVIIITLVVFHTINVLISSYHSVRINEHLR